MGTSDQWNTAFNDVIGLFIEIKIVGSDSGVNASLVEVAVHHFEETWAFFSGGRKHETLAFSELSGYSRSERLDHWLIVF